MPTVKGYFPDDLVAPGLKKRTAHVTELIRARGGTVETNSLYPASGLRSYAFTTRMMSQAQRRFTARFLNDRRGAAQFFYLFSPVLDSIRAGVEASIGTLASQAYAILPYAGSTIYEIRVANVTKSFSKYSLKQRGTVGMYVSPWFNGTNSSINVGTGSSLRITGDVTVCCWINATVAAGAFIFSNENQNSNGFSFGISTGVPGPLFFATSQASARTVATSTVVSLNRGEWHHIAAVKTGGFVTFYLDGSAGAPHAITDPVAPSGSNASFIGSWPAGTFPQQAMTQDLRVYNAALTTPQIVAAMNDDLTVAAVTQNTNLQGHWLLNEGWGTTIKDISGKGNNGTASNLRWVGGEDLVIFSSAQTGAVDATLTGRPRIFAHNTSDNIDEEYVDNAGNFLTTFSATFDEMLGDPGVL